MLLIVVGLQIRQTDVSSCFHEAKSNIIAISNKKHDWRDMFSTNIN